MWNISGLLILVGITLSLGKEIQHRFSVENRIAGGNPAELGQFPYHVGVRTRKINVELGEYDSWCGGSLISEQFVLTAGHCLHEGVSTQIILGGTDLSQDEPARIIITIPKENMIVHEKYVPVYLHNDIALVRLPEKITLNKYIQTVKLPRLSQKNITFEKTVGWITGWGIQGDHKKSPKHLQYARRWILPNEFCLHHLGNFYNKEFHVCVDGSHGISSCSGDSGGPLTIVEEDGSIILVGASSYGAPLCERNFPAGYIRITAHLHWISGKTGIKLRE